MDSPYLSLISLVRGWPQQNGAARGFDGAMALIGSVAKSPRPLVLDLTMEQSARGTTSLFIRSSWDLQLGLGGLSKIADETAGNAIRLALLISSALNRPWNGFNGLLKYYLVFLATPKNNAGLQRVSILTEVSNSEIAAPNNVCVPAAK